ncbi:uncharacterized protein LOC112088120 [Eutrema salsugineum]|uniref:uncharacterized protein LOC112088120 n=1 Tax=Eutrema salsugineum TaxID=72664 RepID=UPI000CED2C97|nr:uncharacterized protein LOC112088120 [Eutrema salsugineum]
MHYPHRKLVLADEFDNRILCTMPSEIINKFEDVLLEGEWYFLGNFAVTDRLPHPSISSNNCHIRLNEDTITEKTDPKSSREIYSFCAYIDILLALIQTDRYLVDVLGIVTFVQKLQSGVHMSDTSDRPTERPLIRFVLEDLDGNSLKCIAWDNLATKFEELWTNRDKSSRHSIVLRFFSFNRWRDEWIVESERFISDILEDPPTPEVAIAKMRLETAVDFTPLDDEYEEQFP